MVSPRAGFSRSTSVADSGRGLMCNLMHEEDKKKSKIGSTRPLTPQRRVIKEQRQKVKARNPGIKAPEINRLLSEKKQSLSPRKRRGRHPVSAQRDCHLACVSRGEDCATGVEFKDIWRESVGRVLHDI
ncbi:hypothetical protein C0Q70_10306 [Pomacea canaliculata]|uniref:Uncharacterized protein n=1 Tax=Pomacea canaliculata TaxID=400727 RepID=A0A2T7PC89_POMCA|nr:hypothetical protein C0Q70_10306 [Pomacea canaliculata]